MHVYAHVHVILYVYIHTCIVTIVFVALWAESNTVLHVGKLPAGTCVWACAVGANALIAF